MSDDEGYWLWELSTVGITSLIPTMGILQVVVGCVLSLLVGVPTSLGRPAGIRM